MKNLLSVFALACSLFVAGCGGSNDVTGSETITSARVPLSVMTVFNAKYPDAVDVTWAERTRTGQLEYEASFMKDGKKKHVQYTERQGVVMEN